MLGWPFRPKKDLCFNGHSHTDGENFSRLKFLHTVTATRLKMRLINATANFFGLPTPVSLFKSATETNRDGR